MLATTPYRIACDVSGTFGNIIFPQKLGQSLYAHEWQYIFSPSSPLIRFLDLLVFCPFTLVIAAEAFLLLIWITDLRNSAISFFRGPHSYIIHLLYTVLCTYNERSWIIHFGCMYNNDRIGRSLEFCVKSMFSNVLTSTFTSIPQIY